MRQENHDNLRYAREEAVMMENQVRTSDHLHAGGPPCSTRCGSGGSSSLENAASLFEHMGTAKNAFALIINLQFDEELHKEFCAHITLCEEHEKFDFSSIAREKSWTWRSYWEVIVAAMSFGMWRRKLSRRDLHIPDTIISAVKDADDCGRALVISFLSSRLHVDRRLSAGPLAEIDIKLANITGTIDPAKWEQ